MRQRMLKKLKAISEELQRRRHEPIPDQGRSVRGVLSDRHPYRDQMLIATGFLDRSSESKRMSFWRFDFLLQSDAAFDLAVGMDTVVRRVPVRLRLRSTSDKQCQETD